MIPLAKHERFKVAVLLRILGGVEMKCPQCGSEDMRVWVEVCMYIDIHDYGKLTKKAIAKKTTELWSVNDNKTVFICKTCCYSSK